MELNKRYITGDVELRSSDDGKEYFEGYGIVFNKESSVLRSIGGNQFIEIITPEAVRNTDFSDVIGRGEHSNQYVLGRTKSGTMQLTVDEVGVRYRIEKPNTTAGNDFSEYVKRGDITGSSFAFYDAKSDVEKRSDGMLIRRITELPLVVDMGPVFNPAYSDSTSQVYARSVDEFAESTEEVKETKEEVKETPKEEIQVGLTTSEKVKVKRLKG